MKNLTNKAKILWNDISNLFRTKNWKEIFRILIFLLLTLVIFSTFSLSGRSGWNNVNNLFYAILLLTIFIYIIIYGKFVFDNFFVLLLTFNFSLIISSLINWRFENQNITMLLLSLTVFIIYQYLINDKENLNHFLIALVVGGLLYMLHFFIIYAKPLLTINLSERLGSYFENVNAVAANMSTLVLLFLYLAVFKKKKIMYVFAFIGTWFTITTGSMWSIFMLILMIFVIVFYKIPKSKKYIFWLTLFGTLILGFAIIQIPALDYFKRRVYGIINTIFGVETGSYDSSSSFRLQLANEAYFLFFRKPLFGFGPGQVTEYASISTYAHNNIAELLANYGLFGFLAFQSLFFVPLIITIKKKPDNSILVILWLLHRVILQLNSIFYYSKIMYFILGFVFANIYAPSLKSIHLNLSFSLYKQENSLG